RSLMIAIVIGVLGVFTVIALTLLTHSQFGLWRVILCAFILLNCLRGWAIARQLIRLEQAPRHEGFACPSCQNKPPKGAHWICAKCRTAFDTFETHATCPNCQTQFDVTRCSNCGRSSPLAQWVIPPPIPVRTG